MNKSKIKLITVIYEPAKEGGYIAYAPSLPGCNTQGDTLEEAEKNITEAALLYLEEVSESEQIEQPKSSPLIGSVLVYA
ncbi:MAG: type II toxin-antitoxin system HicB family antitoxin [Candidatus Parcubacteria bacterium]|nr:type II toxin-antitoxin system HicB family antitoxin [Candidatus Parcubacteria bacterium]